MNKRLLLLVLILALTLFGCKGKPTKTTEAPLARDIKQTVDTIKVVQHKDGLPSFSLEAGSLKEYESFVEFMDLSRVITFSGGNSELLLQSRSARWYEREGRLVADGDVTIEGLRDDFILHSPLLIYRTFSETFQTEGRSSLETPSYRVVADSFSGDVKEKTVSAEGNLYLETEDDLLVQGSYLEFNWESRDYRIKGPITAKID